MSAKDKINDFQTPKDVAKYMVNMLPEDIDYVLEPTPGLGTIVKLVLGNMDKVRTAINGVKVKRLKKQYYVQAV